MVDIRPIDCKLYLDDVLVISQLVFIDVAECHINILDFIKYKLTDHFADCGFRYGIEYNLIVTQCIYTGLTVKYKFKKRG